MKKLVIAFCAGLLALGLVACSGGSGSTAASATASSASASAASASVSAASSASASGSSAATSDSASAASASAAASATAAAGATSFDWVSFVMPDGWVDANESDNYVTISDSSNDRRKIKVFKKTLTSSAPTAADYAAKEVAEHADKYTDEGKKTVGDYEWNLVGFTFNGNPSVYVYADVAEKKCVYATIYEMTIDDPAVQTVLSSLSVDTSKL